MRVLFVEDDPVIACELALRWRARGWVARNAGTLAEADAALAQDKVELIVLDLSLPDGDGLDWVARLRRLDRTTPLLILTARDRVVDRVAGLRNGADDYLVKPFAVDELDARVEGLMRRAQIARGELAHYGGITWLGRECRAYIAGQAMDLSPREFEVLGILIRHAPRLVPKRALIDALAERNLEVGDSAAEVYISRLRRKLVGSGTAIRTLRGFGYQLALDADCPS